MSEPRLINDIFCLIAEELYQEYYSLEAKTALLDLCVTSRAMYQIIIPVIYRNIRLTVDPDRALFCFRTLLQNDFAASSVRILYMNNLFSECHSGSELVLGPSTLIPLFSATLRRLNNLSSLYFTPIVLGSQNELTELFNTKYPFSLRVLEVDFRGIFLPMINFINGQSGLRHLIFTYQLPTTAASSLRVATLEGVTLCSDYTSYEALTALLTHHPQIKHVTLKIFPDMPERTLHSMVALILESTKNLMSLHLMLNSFGNLPIAPANTGGSVWNSSIRLLKMTFSGERSIANVLISSYFNAVLQGKFPNLTAAWLVHCGPQPTSVLRPSASRVQGATWDFYCESTSREMRLARCEKGKDNWTIEEIDQKDIPAVRDSLFQMS